ncbi:lipopolysaccharide heptosyltransferase II [Vibrio sp. 10N.286.49.C2]|uniref:lipopolysaccharide heptosyltransferase II n=1 Tax=unclassified Vibrio TaxID=2614977 RepID=UPI000C84D1C7|nr:MULTISPECIES: lipopolysaccharide heptosyltransferase II [unclassified Vibrio]PMH34500.1 lipopolysaccharide heptosyltransferase II [Vibrio sp. 10N.286.49.C2]PMH46985.1 lipopolysaccharide heptosyltransferase II [Vibrio sp. 10N.286.49.B1]
MKILVIGPSWVGDMVMSQSLYIELKRRHPEASIDVLAPAWCKPILQRMPEVNTAIEMPIGHGAFDLMGRWKIGRRLKAEKYTHAYVLPNSAKSALIPIFAGIPNRIGWKGESRYGLLTDLRPNKRIFQYYVERFVALASKKENMLDEVALATCPRPALSIDPTVQQQALEKFQLSTTRTAMGMCPGAEFGPAKRWPDEHYAQVAQHLIDSGKQVWLFGSAKDRDVTEKIRQRLTAEAQMHCFNLAGSTSLTEAVDLLAACDTVISNDSGLMHVSAAVGCNIVAIYGSSSPDYTPPLGDQVAIVHTDIECRPCFKRECPLGHLNCLKQLNPDMVLKHLE